MKKPWLEKLGFGGPRRPPEPPIAFDDMRVNALAEKIVLLMLMPDPKYPNRNFYQEFCDQTGRWLLERIKAKEPDLDYGNSEANVRLCAPNACIEQYVRLHESDQEELTSMFNNSHAGDVKAAVTEFILHDDASVISTIADRFIARIKSGEHVDPPKSPSLPPMT